MDTAELRVVAELLDELEGDLDHLNSEDLLHRATVMAHELPTRIRLCLNAFRLERLSGVLCISGYVVDQDRLGPTPSHWRDQPSRSSAFREELLRTAWITDR
jgi:hypothetical protein